MILGKANPSNLRTAVSVRHICIGEEEVGQRIDNFLLRECKGVPKSHIYRILRSGEVRVNGGRIDQTYRLAMGDAVRIPPVRVAERQALATIPVAAQRNLDVVFEDDSLLVINKPAGLAVHGGSGISYGVIEQLRQQRPTARFLELVHRLDRDTSGLLIVAKRRAALTAMQDMMRAGTVEKRYVAMVSGRWANPLQHIRSALHKYLTEDGERRVSVSTNGKPSHSIVRLVKRWEQFSLVEVELKTGRTHQIRVHLQSVGFPLLGDDKYGDFPLNKILAKQGLQRMFLHSAVLRFNHPSSNLLLSLKAPLPDDLSRWIAHVDAAQNRDYG
ncbi:MAG TPA: RluA family pseudouridine synthase [Rhodocyclaceae bacterium]|nr:RluA family pseudouridine synthase [Rhodocyclaceae bacterium]